VRQLRAGAPWVLLMVVELGLYFSYRAHSARFHWATHFLVGGAFALAGMAWWSWFRRRPARWPAFWILSAHLYAMFPDFLFEAGHAHQWWMEIFLLHIRSHFVPGRNVCWIVVFLMTLAGYLAVLDRRARNSTADWDGGPGPAVPRSALSRRT
jgi:hypothetical protein